jgi:hypothetical protein
MVKLLAIFFLTLLSLSGHGQSQEFTKKIRKSNIRFSMGMLHTRLIDEGYTDSKLLFRKTNFAFQAGYRMEHLNYIFDVSLAGSIGKVTSKSGNLTSDFYFGEVSVDYARRISSYQLFGKESKFFGGIKLSTTNYGIASMRVIDNVSIFSLHGLYLQLHNLLVLDEKQSLSVAYSVPLVVYQNRLLWNGGANEFTYKEILNIPRLMTTNGEVSYFSITKNIQFDVVYTIRLRELTSFEIGYEFWYASSAIEAPIHLYSNKFMVGLKFKL